MTCEEVREVIELYALGVLDGQESADVHAHITGGCKVCSMNLQEAMSLNALVLATASSEEPSPALRDRILASVAVAGKRGARVARPWAWITIAASLAAVAVWTTLDSQNQRTQLSEARRQLAATQGETERLGAAFAFLRDPQTRPANAKPGGNEARGTYFISPRGVLLIASGLGALPPGRTYEMWVIPKGQAPRPAGLFRPDPSGTAVHFQQSPVDVASAQALAITVEPETGSAAPTTTPLLVTPVTGT